MLREFPKVTIAVPLYRSRRFLAIVTDTLRTLDYPNLEILISDRHHEDDAIDRLQQEFAADPRFRFLLAADRLDWRAHYNLLLKEASGKYFIWISHDDSYSADYITQLVEAMEENPDAVLTYGQVKRIDLNGKPLTYVHPRIRDYGNPGFLTACRIAMSAGLQFHGLFRRQVLLDRQLYIRPTVNNIAADMLWLFAVAMIGRMVFVESCTFLKRYYPSSTHKSWDSLMRPRYSWNFAAIACSYLDDFARTRFERGAGKIVVYSLCGTWAIRLFLRPLVRRLWPSLYHVPGTDA
ncbi:MAG: glycosyltransferase family 2 protein [Bryobacteraceae bacterium]